MPEPSIVASLISVLILWSCGTLTLAGLRSNWNPSQDVLGIFLSLPLGVALHQSWTLFLLVGNLGTGTRSDAFALLGLSAAVVVYRRRKLRNLFRFIFLNLFSFSVSQLALATFVNSRNLVNWHTDSFHHLAIGRALADGRYEQISNMMKEWRGLSASPSMALAAKWGGQYGVTLVPTLALCLTALILFYFFRAVGPLYDSLKVKDRIRLILKSEVALKFGLFCNLVFILYALITSDRFQFHAFYLNTHLQLSVLFICLMILLPHSNAENLTSDAPTLLGSYAYEILVLAIFLTRVEGQLLVAPLIVLVASTQHSPLRCLRFGGTPIILAIAKQLGERGQGWVESLSSREVLLQITVLFVSLLLFKIFDTNSELVPVIFDPRWFWIATIFGVMINETVRESIPIIWQNLFLGEGSWGLSFYFLLAGVLLLLILGPSRRTSIEENRTRTPATAERLIAGSYFAVMIFTHLLRGSPGRIGHNDSFNRAALTGFILVIFWILKKTEIIGEGVEGRNPPKDMTE